MNDVQDQSLDFDEYEIITTMFELGIAFKLTLQVTFVVLQLSLLDSICTISSKSEHFR